MVGWRFLSNFIQGAVFFRSNSYLNRIEGETCPNMICNLRFPYNWAQENGNLEILSKFRFYYQDNLSELFKFYFPRNHQVKIPVFETLHLCSLPENYKDTITLEILPEAIFLGRTGLTCKKLTTSICC